MSDEKFLDLNMPRAEKMAAMISKTIAASVRSNKASSDAIVQVLNPIDEALSDLWPDDAPGGPVGSEADEVPELVDDTQDEEPQDEEPRPRDLPTGAIPTDPLAVSHYIHMLDDASFMAAAAAVTARLNDHAVDLREQASQ